MRGNGTSATHNWSVPGPYQYGTVIQLYRTVQCTVTFELVWGINLLEGDTSGQTNKKNQSKSRKQRKNRKKYSEINQCVEHPDPLRHPGIGKNWNNRPICEYIYTIPIHGPGCPFRAVDFPIKRHRETPSATIPVPFYRSCIFLCCELPCSTSSRHRP